MHELGLAQSVLDLVRQYVPESSASSVRTIRVRIGELSGVVADSLAFCFDAVTADTPYRSAALAIDRVAPTARCLNCACTFSCRGYGDTCIECGGTRVTLVTGRELQVVDVELDERPEVPR